MSGFGSRRMASGIGAVVSAALLMSACGSSSGGTRVSNAASRQSAGGQGQGVTINSASVPGFGTVLVDGSGHTLYMLTSEQGSKITCTDDNGCTKLWPDTELPKGVTSATAGSGVQSSLLGTVKDAAGSLYVTYGGWPLYTFSGDSGPGQATGEGVTDTWGTWYVLGVDGQPIKVRSGGAATTTTAPQSGGAGF